jgi:hypothetical protein
MEEEYPHKPSIEQVRLLHALSCVESFYINTTLFKNPPNNNKPINNTTSAFDFVVTKT